MTRRSANRWFRLSRLVGVASASLMLSACATHGTTDAMINYDHRAGELRVSSIPEGTPWTRIPVASPLVVDFNIRSRTLCAMSPDQEVWLASLQQARVHVLADLSPERAERLILADNEGRCIYAASSSSAAVSGPGQTTIVVDVGDDFGWQDISYSDRLGTVALVGRASFVMLQADDERIKPRIVSVHGQIRNTRFGSLKCCAALSPDGRTLYSIATMINDTNTGKQTVVAIDTDTGDITQMYLPWAPDDTDLIENRYRPPPGSIAIGSAEHPLFLSPDGATLYVSAISADESRTYNRLTLAAINIADGMIREIPHAYGLKGISASGRHLMVRTFEDELQGPTRHDDDRIVVPVPNSFRRAGHGKGNYRADATVVLDVPRELKPGSASSAVSRAILAVMRGTVTRAEFREVVTPTQAPNLEIFRDELGTSSRTLSDTFDHDFLIADYETSAWNDFKDHCRRWAHRFDRVDRVMNEKLCLLSSLVDDE